MLLQLIQNIFGEPKGAYVIQRMERGMLADGREEDREVRRFRVRPGVVVIEDDRLRLRNFTDSAVVVEASFLETQHKLEPRERLKVKVKDGIAPGFYPYKVTVKAQGGDEEAQGDSRPGAIIDR